MPTHIPFPSIEKFKTTITNIKKVVDKNTLDPIVKYPIVKAKGYVKLHGTNGGVGFNNKDGMWCQSRNNIITSKNDNAGCAFHIEKAKTVFQGYFQRISEMYKVDYDVNTVVIYGEWCGQTIQKGVALCELPKMFVIFKILMTTPTVPTGSYESLGGFVWTSQKWLDPTCLVSSPENRIYNITDFPSFEIVIDLNDFKASQNELVRLTKQVEVCCPVGHALGVDGIGEGIVWTMIIDNSFGNSFENSFTKEWMFKTKGELHSATKVKTIVAVDTEKIENAKQFVEATVTQTRFNQAIDALYKINPQNPLYGKTPEIKDIPKVIEWVRDDIFKEDMDLLIENNLEPKDIFGLLSKSVVSMFKKL